MMPARPSSEMQVLLDRLAIEDSGLPDPTKLSPADGRAQAAQANIRWNRALPMMSDIQTFSLPGEGGRPVTCRLYVPRQASKGCIFYVHGGGWAFCDIDTHDRAVRLLAIEAGTPVLTCDYRLAPEHPFPSGLLDCIAIWRALREKQRPLHALDGPLAISGDSAGANLALGLMLSELVEGLPLPDFGLLFYGVYGADFSSPSYIECAEGPGLTREKMMRYWDWYANVEQRDDPRAHPLVANDSALAALPPLYLNAAAIDPLRSDSERLYARLAGLGRADQFRLHGGVVHGFMQMSLELAEARQAFVDAGAAFRKSAGRSAHKNCQKEEIQ